MASHDYNTRSNLNVFEVFETVDKLIDLEKKCFHNSMV